MTKDSLLTEEKWENFDAEGLFSPPSKLIHANKLIRTDEFVAEFTAGTKEELPNHLDELELTEGDTDNNEEVEIEADEVIDERGIKEEEEDAEKEPIQKEKEGIEEVVEATTKTSENIHGGDEATKDIENSPNPADNGISQQNQKRSLNKPNLLDKEDWERKANSSGSRRLVLDSLNEIKRESKKESQGMGYGYFFGENEALRPQMETVFKKSKELLERFANEEDVSQRITGTQKWDAEKVVLCSVKLQHQKISDAKYGYQKEADIIVYLDISGSCYKQAEMFAAIGSSIIGPSVRIYIGYNGYVRKRPLAPPKKRLSNYSQALAWVKKELEKIKGWDKRWEIGEWDFVEFIKLHSPKTAIIFGDFDGLEMYEEAVKVAKKSKLYWFANVGSWVDTPKGFNNKNFFKEVFEPKDFLRVLRKLR